MAKRRGAHDLRRDRRLRHVGRRVPHDRARRKTATAPCRVMQAAIESRRHPARPGRLHQRPRHLDAAQRSHRDHGDQAHLRRSRLQAGDLVDQVDDRPPAGRRRRPRGRHHRAVGAGIRWWRRRSTSMRRMRAAISTTCPTRRAQMKIDYALSNSFGFGGTNGALLFKRYEE